MNNRSMKLAKFLVMVSGIIVLTCGIIHFAWAFRLESLEKGLMMHQKDFIVLCIVCIGLCLTIFGLLSIYCSRVLYNKLTRIFIFSQSILWIIRTVFEILWPVHVPILIIKQPSNTIIVGGIILTLSYAITFLLLIRIKNNVT